jgi:O-antigen/teichoic acid export membrane protein
MSTAKTLAKGTFWGVLASLFIKITGVLYYIILARMATQQEVGAFFLAFSIVSVVLIFSDLGLGPGAVSRYVPFFIGKEEYNSVKKATSIALTAGTAFSVICMFAVIYFAGEIASFFNEPDLVPLLQILAIYIFIYNFYQTAYTYLIGRKLIKLGSYESSIQGLGKLIFTVLLFLLLGASANNIALGFTLSFAVAAACGMRWMAKDYLSLPKSGEKIPDGLFKEMIVFGMTIVILSSMSTINSSFDRLMMGYLLPSETSQELIGIYSIAISFTSVLTLFINPIGNIFQPVATESIGKNDESRVEEASATYSRWMALSTTPIMLMVVLFPKEILEIIYGPGYTRGYMVLVIYCFGLFIYSFSYPVQALLSAVKRLNETAKIVTAGTILNIALNALLIPQYEMEGAAFASAVSFCFMTYLFIRTGRMSRFRIRYDIRKALLAGILALLPLVVLKYITSGLILGAGSTITQNIIEDLTHKAAKFMLMGLIFAIISFVYLAFLIYLRAFAREDVDVLSSGMRRLGLPLKWIHMIERILMRRQLKKVSERHYE